MEVLLQISRFLLRLNGYMAERTKGPISLRFNSIRLNDLSDDYGFGDDHDMLDETLEANNAQMNGEDSLAPLGGNDNGSDSDSQRTMDRSSIGSNESKETSSTSKIGAFFDRAKARGKKLVSSNRTPGKFSNHVTATASQCVIVAPLKPPKEKDKNTQAEIQPSSQLLIHSFVRRYRNMPFLQFRLVLLGLLFSITIVFPGFITGFMWGLYLSFVGFLYLFVSDQQPQRDPSLMKPHRLSFDEGILEDAQEAVGGEGNGLGLGEGVVYRGWMNELRGRYSPATYHVNQAQSVLVRLEGSTLRISRPAKAVLKHAFHEDPTLTQPQPTMVSQTIYSLINAHVSLRPKRLARRRWWVRKYPIYIRFSRKAGNIVNVSKPLLRSASMHPVGTAPESFPSLETDGPSLFDDGYTAESDSNDESEPDDMRRSRANSLTEGDDFVSVPVAGTTSSKHRSLYLFVRAAREKERWFHLLREACAQSKGLTKPMKKRRNSEVRFALECPSLPDTIFEDAVYKRIHAQFAQQISLICGSGVPQPERGSTVSVDLGTVKWKPGIPEENSDLVESINSLGTRIFFDFCRDEFWAKQVQQKIQSKLATIHLPYFIEKLELSSITLGRTAPRIVGVYAPKLNEWGIWVDLEMKYAGGIRLVLQTSVNLLKLQSGAAKVEADRKINRFTDIMAIASHYSDDEVPQSPESSPDEDFGAKNNLENTSTREKTGKKIISMVERAAQSSLFQKAAKFSKVAKLIEDVSTTPLILNVEVEMLEGPITVNIPPPPSDRLWYGFRRPPLTSIRAVPQVGDRSVDMSTVSDWIESKLRLLIEKNLVCPNMDDITLPVMSGNELLQKGAYNQ
ncbi:hypothetical protein KIN20_016640 [Parelaphostrongylus tenuis]|uniref:SMP-LTD domain-containing protein n=1 Tax=Parelaphostrongylus tenuis TaxID=148309 RepID=A0AAD5MZY3_PARTN|nr:hypothetical protein KIN20_016640 [Parelaphostrongylus tenuis]